MLVLAMTFGADAKSMPKNMVISDDGRMLLTVAQKYDGLYDIENIQVIELKFEQADWWEQLINNRDSKTDVTANLYYEGKEYKGVGVRFRGETSYIMVDNSQKKSFNISIDFTDQDLRLAGYKTLNLNNCFQDPSFMKEVMYSHLAGNYVPLMRANFAKLIINGENWGIYSNVQQLNREFYDEWFLSNDGVNWRAKIPDTTTLPKGPGGFVGFGTGFSTLNYFSKNPIEYTRYYQLKSSKIDDPWHILVTTCEKLNTLPVELLYDSLKYYIDVDRALWHIAVENVFTDDDGYMNKGGSDYYIYYDVETNRLTPIIYDGNSTFMNNKINHSLFYREPDNRFPLINRIFANPQLKQRYIAHVRTLVNNLFIPEQVNAVIDKFRNLIVNEVKSDNKKLYSEVQFNRSVGSLKDFIRDRRNFIINNDMLKAAPPIINTVDYISSAGKNIAPKHNEKVKINANIAAQNGIAKVFLYYGTGLAGTFDVIEMYDDGVHGDGSPNDGIYGAEIPGYSAGTYVRYYIEAIANNNFRTAAFSPEGAEAHVYFYQVETEILENPPIVINEFMASNGTTIADPQGDYDDWIELYNRSDKDIVLSGMYLSDKTDNPKKWKFPDNVVLKAGEYLLVWADENGKATPGLHANFKLAAEGEVIILSHNDANNNVIIDSVHFGPQQRDISYGRFPNGTGKFAKMPPTPGAVNISPLTNIESEHTIFLKVEEIYPNPFSDYINFRLLIDLPGNYTIEIYDNIGEKVNSIIDNYLESGIYNFSWDTRDFRGMPVTSGIYYINIRNEKGTYTKAVICEK
jgi:hypothetical protein